MRAWLAGGASWWWLPLCSSCPCPIASSDWLVSAARRTDAAAAWQKQRGNGGLLTYNTLPAHAGLLSQSRGCPTPSMQDIPVQTCMSALYFHAQCW